MLLEKAAAWHLVVLKSEQRSTATLEAYRQVHRQFTAFLSQHLGRPPTLADLTLDNARGWQADLRDRKRSGTTVSNYTRLLKGWTRRLVDDFGADLPGVFPDGNPLARLGVPKRDEKEPAVYTREQVELILLACQKTRDSLRNKALLLLMFESGLRNSEVCSLNQDQMTWAMPDTNGRVKVLGKGRKERFVGFGLRTSKAILAYLATRNDDDPALFRSHYQGRRLSPSMVRGVFSTLQEITGITTEHLHPHGARHTFASWRADADMSLVGIQHQLGHSRLSQTERYIKRVGRNIDRTYQPMLDGPPQKRNARS